MFTELPYEHHTLERNWTKVIEKYVHLISRDEATAYIPTFHISLFGRETVEGQFPFNRMMQALGFEVLWDPSMLSCHPHCHGAPLRKGGSLNDYVHRKPSRAVRPPDH